MRIIRAADCRRMPWRNGGGETVEIATDPAGAGLDAFTWRLSAARVAQDGPFSLFPGIDRTLAVLSGAMELRFGESVTRLGPEDAPLPFPGDRPTVAHLAGGAVEDLNIMTRRGVVRHRMRRLALAGVTSAVIEGDAVLLFCADGRAAVDGETLEARDTAVLNGVERRDMTVDGQGRLYVIEVEAIS